jgi:hypothetical protein
MRRRLAPSTLLFLPVLLGLSALLLGCPLQPAALTGTLRPERFPQRSCAAVWAGRRDVDYDYGRDPRPCPQGNCGYADYAGRIDRSSCFKQWTVLVYMAADVDAQLAPWALENLAEMEDALGVPAPADETRGSRTATTVKTDVVVQLDSRSDQTAIRRLHVFQTGAAAPSSLPRDPLRGSASELHSPIVALLPHRNMDTPAQLLRDFLIWGIRAYPAQHYLVIVWGHGQGWGDDQRQPIAGPPGTPFPGFSGGLALDFRQRTYLGIPALHQVLRQAAAVAGRPIDIYASDACLMQSVEVATELADTTKYIVGTTQIEPLGGLPYGDMLAFLNGDRPPPPPGCASAADGEACAVASMIPDRYAQALQRPPRRELHTQHPQAPAALSALRSDELLHSLLPTLARLGSRLAPYLAQDSFGRIRLQERLGSGGSALGNSRELDLLLADLQSVLDEAHDGRDTPAAGELRQALAQGKEALAQVLLSTSVPDLGLSVWMPPTRDDYQRNKARYGVSLFFKYGRPAAAPPGPWESFLARLWN